MAVSGAQAGDPGGFSPVVAVALGVVGLLAFMVMVLAGTFGSGQSGRRGGGANAVSVAATGYSGLVALADATGRHPRIVRDEHGLDTEDLTVLTPEHGWVDMNDALARRNGRATLLVLPKWNTEADRHHRGWVRRDGLLPARDPGGVLAPETPFTIRRRASGGRALVTLKDGPDLEIAAPRPLQVITGVPATEGRKPTTLHPLLTDGHCGIVLARVGDGSLYVLSDPDLVDNLGVADPARAEAALALLDGLTTGDADGIAFDVTLNGLGGHRNLFRLALTPPFLPCTLTLLLAALLGTLHGLGRFGPTVARPRAIAFGKAALLDNVAALVRLARREGRLGGRYAGLIRELARSRFAVPVRLRDEAVDAYLDRIGGGARFSALAGDVSKATTGPALVAAARRLHGWLGETTR